MLLYDIMEITPTISDSIYVSEESVKVSNSCPTLCLNMIVKNESKVITRLLDSVSKVIDSYCICDTGSTDNTIKIITEFFQKKGISGTIVKEPFRDFGYNRTFALDAARNQPNADYLLLLDADMIFWLNPDITPVEFKMMLLEGDAFFIYQGSDNFYYKNTRVIRNNAGVKYWGVTHEYTEFPEGFNSIQIQKNRAFVRDIGDGGAKTDKYERDIRLLQKGLLEKPDNVRYLFYLANSYMNGGYPDDAIKMYKRRIAAGGWVEEIWYSCYNIGKIYREKNDMANAFWWWMEAYRHFPNRIEQLYEIVKYYRENHVNDLGHMFYELADRARKNHPVLDYLFMEKDVYDYKLDYEFSIIGYYTNPNKVDLAKLSMKVLADSKVDIGISKNTLSNYKFYASKLSNWDVCKDVEYMNSTHSGRNLLRVIDSLRKVGEKTSSTWDDRDSLFKSTPSIIALSSSMFVVSQRYVNYYINDNGGYEQNGDITTRNVIGIVDDGDLVREFELKYDTSADGVYRGLEDVRLWTSSDGDVSEVPSIYYSSNRGLGHSNMVVEVGKIDLINKTTVETRHLKMNTDHGRKRDLEKNWVIINVDPSDSGTTDKYNMIYDWNPVVTGSASENTFDVQKKQESLPDFFRYLRGSTNSVEVGNELWFIAHAVSYEDRRYYYHIVVAMDKTTKEIKKYTPFFTFQGEKVEYTLGMVLVDSRLIIGYSVMDKRAEWMVVPQHVISDMFISI